MAKKYLPRIADALLKECLERSGAVVVRGPKWCGKTETSLQQAKSVLYLQDPDEAEENMRIANVKPSLLLAGEQPRLIDEWQDAPQLWDAVRHAVDREGGAGHYILTGSTTPQNTPKHSGTGRFAFLDMIPMSLFESRESTNEVSLGTLFETPDDISGKSLLDIEDLSFLCCRGGWPEAVLKQSEKAALGLAKDYVKAVTEEDIPRINGVSQNKQYAKLILQAYSRCTATQASTASIRQSIKLQKGEIAKATVDVYLSALRKLYVIEDQPAWEPSLHARSRITTTPTRHLVDPSLAAASIGASPQLLLKDMSTFGTLFESLCIRDLRAYSQARDGQIFHYHDNTGLEADAVIVLEDGRWGLCEIKMSQNLIDEAAKTLFKLANKIDTSIMGEPSFLLVITARGYAYRRSDDVYVVPIGCLAP